MTGLTVQQWSPKQLISRLDCDTLVRGVRIKGGSGVLAAGTVLGRLSASPNQLAPYANANSNGTEVAVCILVSPVDASGASDVNGLALFEGVVNESALVQSGAGSLDSAGKTDLGAKYVAAGEIKIRGGY